MADRLIAKGGNMNSKPQVIIDNRWLEGEFKRYRPSQAELDQNEREKQEQAERDRKAQEASDALHRAEEAARSLT